MKRLLLCLAFVSCDAPAKSSDQIDRERQEQLSKESSMQVGMPAIVNFQEKRILKDIIELRDKQISTFTYVMDMNGKLHKVCTSVGYGIPAATQFTNPQRMVTGYQSLAPLPQADPNGLFSPNSADGTWVLCVNPKTGKTAPVYMEPRIIVSPFELGQ